jgi:peptidoglycan hydrolase-like protein with peptidoglycan-binding domain
VIACRRACFAVVVVAIGVLTVVATAAARPVGTLKAGTKGASVRELQRELGQIGLDVNVDGVYGSSTAAAVGVFQHAINISVTGVADHPTRHLLHNVIQRSEASVAQAPSQSGGMGADTVVVHHLGERIPVEKGMSGPDVSELQQLLVKNGQKVKVDGNFGPSTYHAERGFEKKTGLTVDGIVDAEDIDALRGDVAPTDTAGAGTDPTDPTAPTPAALGPGDTATIGSDGLAIAPADAPAAVQDMISAGNQIALTPYRFGGGHGRFKDTAYDCSGSVSFALHGGDLLSSPLDSTGLESWGSAGPGQWVTVYANAGHAYMVVAGLRFDTSGASAHHGDRWQTAMRSGKGYIVRHPAGL